MGHVSSMDFPVEMSSNGGRGRQWSNTQEVLDTSELYKDQNKRGLVIFILALGQQQKENGMALGERSGSDQFSLSTSTNPIIGQGAYKRGPPRGPRKKGNAKSMA